MIAAVSVTEWLLILFLLAVVGGIPAGIAVVRGRSPIRWFLIGVLCLVLVRMLLPGTFFGEQGRLYISIGVAPAILLLLPAGWRKAKPRIPSDAP